MAFKVAVSGPAFIAKLLRHQVRRQLSPIAAPYTLVSRAFSKGPSPCDSPNYDVYDANPFLREGEEGHCRMEKTKKECYLRVDVPGVTEEDMKVWAKSGFIYFHAKDSKLPGYKYDGRAFGGSISFNPDRYDSDGIKAEVKNGVLWLTVPRIIKN